MFRGCFNLVRRATTRPATEVLKLLDAAIFNPIIGNADAHAKNFSLLYKASGTELAPLYDLLSTIAYPDLSRERHVRSIRRATRRKYSTEDRIRIVLSGLRGVNRFSDRLGKGKKWDDMPPGEP